jgi:hypothetical protein
MTFLQFEGLDKEMVLVDRKTRKKLGQFHNGVLTTENPKLIAKMLGRYQLKVEESAEYRCKKCDYHTFNQGTLMAHYRKQHPKEEEHG